jgi:hypothetical protein
MACNREIFTFTLCLTILERTVSCGRTYVHIVPMETRHVGLQIRISCFTKNCLAHIMQSVVETAGWVFTPIMSLVIQALNFIISGALNLRIFKMTYFETKQNQNNHCFIQRSVGCPRAKSWNAHMTCIKKWQSLFFTETEKKWHLKTYPMVIAANTTNKAGISSMKKKKTYVGIYLTYLI